MGLGLSRTHRTLSSFVVVAAAAACRPGVADPSPWLEVPDAVAVELSLGSPGTLLVDVHNVGTAAGTVVARTDAPFELSDARYGLASGDRRDVPVFVTPEAPGELAGELELRVDDDTWVVALAVTVRADLDGDGFDATSAGGDDCDDDDPDAFPGAQERCNGRDDDCDGAIDESLPTVTQWLDGDGDGFGAGEPVDDCALLDGYASRDGDCDDARSDSFPGAPEQFYDGIDQACDGGDDYDADGDGHARQPEGDDCDDGRADVHPAAPELADEADNDCDGLRDEDSLVAGELVLTEIFAEPDRSATPWVELVNPGTTHAPLGLAELWVGGAVLPLPDRLLGPGELLLVCADADDEANGGLGCDDELALPTGLEHLELVGPHGVIDEVDPRSWDAAVGRSLELSLQSLDAGLNDDESAWCVGVSLFGDDSGDRGTPGELLPPC
jgi:hypothetical protein